MQSKGFVGLCSFSSGLRVFDIVKREWIRLAALSCPPAAAPQGREAGSIWQANVLGESRGQVFLIACAPLPRVRGLKHMIGCESGGHGS